MENIKSVVYLQPLALEELIRAVIETYNRESIGDVFGYTVKRKSPLYVVEVVHPIQIATRKPTEVSADANYEDRTSWSALGDRLGDFHSHNLYYTKGGRSPGTIHLKSDFDVECLRENPQLISIVVAINKTSRVSPVTVNDKLIAGTVKVDGTMYRVGIGVYIYNNRVRKIDIGTSVKALKRIF